MHSQLLQRRAVGALLVGLVIGCLAAPVAVIAQVVWIDAVSREVTFLIPEPSVVYADASSREVTFFLPEPPLVLADAVSREVTFFIPLITIPYADAISREVTFVVPESPVVFGDGISREGSFYFLGTIAVRSGYLGKELVKVPADTVQWMSVASWDHAVSGVADLFVAAATGLGGAATDPRDDFVYRVYSNGAIQDWFSLPEATADPTAIAVSPGSPWDATPDNVQLFVALNEALGATTGPAVMRYDVRGVGSVFAAGSGPVSEPRHLGFLPGAIGGFSDLLYLANGAGTPNLLSVSSGGAPAGYASNISGGANGLAFAVGSTFDSGLYLGGSGRTVYLSDATGQASALTDDLGAGVEALAFGESHGFENYLFALLDDGRVVRINPDGSFEGFLSGIGLPASPSDDRRNDLCFSSGGDQLFVTDAVRGLVYAIQGDRPSGTDPGADVPPAVTDLKGNFPNPFNPSTTISFALSVDGPATLEVYDLAGRRVRQLLTGGSMPAGQHAVVWDGRDESGKAVAAGVYLVSLRTAEKSFSGKIALVK